MAEKKEKKTPSSGYAILCLVIAFAAVMIPSLVFGAKIQSMFYFAWAVAFLMCMPLGYSMQELQNGMFKFMARCLLPLTVCITAGALIGTWCASGTIAYVMKICLQIVSPQYYMVITFIVCLIFSLLTGTSFGTVGTIGIAMMGVGLGLGVNPLLIAAPIIVAAYIGDGISPLSGNPNICAGTIGIDLFKNCSYQATMMIPVIIFHVIFYTVWGRSVSISSQEMAMIDTIIEDMGKDFHLSIICLLPIVVVIAMLVTKFPIIPSLLSGVVSGGLVALFYQNCSITTVASSIWSGYTLNGENELVNSIFTRGGITSMENPAFMFILAFGLFGIFTTAGVIDKAVEPFINKANSRFTGTIGAVLLGAFGNATSASGQFTNMFTCSLMTPIFEKNNLNLWDLARAIPVGCLFAGLLMPWNSNPATTCGFLDVDPITMIPYLLSLPLASFVVLMFYTVTGIDKKFSAFARGEIAARES